MKAVIVKIMWLNCTNACGSFPRRKILNITCIGIHMTIAQAKGIPDNISTALRMSLADDGFSGGGTFPE